MSSSQKSCMLQFSGLPFSRRMRRPFLHFSEMLGVADELPSMPFTFPFLVARLREMSRLSGGYFFCASPCDGRQYPLRVPSSFFFFMAGVFWGGTFFFGFLGVPPPPSPLCPRGCTLFPPQIDNPPFLFLEMQNPLSPTIERDGGC